MTSQAVGCAIAAAVCLLCSLISFTQKGPVLSGIYWRAKKEDRPALRTRVNYFTAAIVFLLLGLIFMLSAMALTVEISWATEGLFCLGLALVIYVLGASIAEYRQKHKARLQKILDNEKKVKKLP